jgi:DNA-binding response OmpR family regulator
MTWRTSARARCGSSPWNCSTEWGYAFDPGTNVVDVYVGRLRAKLSAQLIETVRNVGYCFVVS